MEKKFIATGKDFDSAVQAALKELDLDLESVSVQILERAKSGVFGFGARPCKVEVTYEVPDPAPAAALSAASRSKAKKAPEAPKPKEAPGKEMPAEKPKQAPVQERRPERAPHVRNEERKAAPRQEEKPRIPAEGKEPEAVKAPKVYAPAPTGSVEEQIETFLKGLLEHMGSKAVPHAQKGEEETYRVELVGEDLGMLIGRRGETLDAIQHLSNYAVNRNRDTRVRISVDAEDYRVKREESLRRYARKKAQQVLKAHRRTTLEPMNAYERHVIHASLQEMENITTHSTGTEPNRRVVIEYVR